MIISQSVPFLVSRSVVVSHHCQAMSATECALQPEPLTSLRSTLHLSSPEPRGPALASSPGHAASGSRSSSSTVSSLMELAWTESEDERLTVERVQQTRRQLQDEIEVSESEKTVKTMKNYLFFLQLIVRELTLVGEELHLEAECQKIVQD